MSDSILDPDVDTRFDPIVVATDGSPESMAATRWAAELAGWPGGRTVVLDVVHQPSAEMDPDDVDRFSRDAADALASRLREAGIAPSEQHVIVGDVVTVLSDAAASASMLVLGSAERAGWGRHGHFSLVHTLAHRVDCPIVVVPAGLRAPLQSVIVVGIDGSAASRVALEWAIDLGTRAGLRVVAAFVIAGVYDTFNSGGWYGAAERRAREESAIENVELIERVGADPAVSLEAIAAEHDASLLVVAAKSHHSLHGTLLGAIPDELLHHPTCPVAVIPHSMTAGEIATAGRDEADR